MKPPKKGADLRVWRLACQALSEGKSALHFLELASSSRTAFKAVASVLDGEEGLGVRKQLAELAGPGLSTSSPAKVLLRRATGREAEARTRQNPIVRNDAFDCRHCGFAVPPLDRGERNHCPRCLHSAHVDGPAPGDRSADCGGLMVAEDLEILGGVPRVTHRCQVCGFKRRNRLFPDRQSEPDRIEILLPSEPGDRGGG
jgi:predicted RNA-binding Zn-ribbon protein involved in translation (DUF1610 family)